ELRAHLIGSRPKGKALAGRDPRPRAPCGVGKGGEPLLRRQRVRIAADRRVHESAVERRLGEGLADRKTSASDVDGAGLLLKISLDEVDRRVVRSPEYGLRLEQRVSGKGSAAILAEAVDEGDVAREAFHARQLRPIE